MQQQYVVPTPKAKRVQELRAQGMSFDKAFAIADSEYSNDGMDLLTQDHPEIPREFSVAHAAAKEVTF